MLKRGAVACLLTGTLVLGLAAGCATPPPTPPAAPAFYPPAPSEPRIQHLASITREEDLGRRRSRLLSFLIGRPPPSPPVMKPYGLALNENILFVCDTVARSIDMFDLRRRERDHFSPSGEGKLELPINLAVGSDGTRYVTDPARGRLLIYGRDGRYLGTLDDVAELRPTGVAVTTTRIYLADLFHHHVRVYDRLSRRLLLTIPSDPHNEASRLYSPTNVALDGQGRVYVSDTGAFRVQQYDSDGRHLRTFGKHGDAPGEFARPKGIAVDRDGRVYVVDAAAQVVQLFDPDGRLLMFFGEPGAGAPALNLPAGITVDYDHLELFQACAAPGFELEYLVLVSSQYGNHKVNIYGFGRRRASEEVTTAFHRPAHPGQRPIP